MQPQEEKPLEEQVTDIFDDVSQISVPSKSSSKQSVVEVNHLVILVHGLHGSKSDLNTIRKALIEKHKNLFVHCAESNDGFLMTHDGIDEGGKRIAKEVEEITTNLLNQGHPITKFSIIGHSLGGLYSRYCIGILFEHNYFEKFSPVNFITFATPHVGSRRTPRHKFNHVVNAFTSILFDATGRQLMLEDSASYPLLLKMSRPNEIFYQGLALFKHRLLYSNISWDFQVPYTTSAIVSRNPYSNSPKQPRYKETHPHIVEPEPEEPNSEVDPELFANDSKKEFLAEILKSLQALEWKRVDTNLRSAMAHEMIVAKRKWVPNNGTDIVDHLADAFQNIQDELSLGHQS